MKIHLSRLRLALFFALCLPVAPAPVAHARADEITVSAAASLREVLENLGADFSRSGPAKGTQVRFNFGSSGALQKQIEAGAPVDLFISAARKNIVQLAQSGDIDGATRRVVARGELVLIAPHNSKVRSFSDLRGADVRVISIGGIGVPAGDYARQTLDFLHLSAPLQPKLIFAKDVRSVLNAVALGNADAGFVYRTDALRSSAVRVIASAPPRSHDAVIYPVAVVKDAPNRVGAVRFWRFLQSSKARATFKRFGFLA